MDNLIQEIVRKYREVYPQSRAQGTWTYVGSTSCVKKATCIFCREVVATCSNRYRETKIFHQEANEHASQCAIKWYYSGMVKGLKKKQREAGNNL